MIAPINKAPKNTIANSIFLLAYKVNVCISFTVFLGDSLLKLYLRTLKTFQGFKKLSAILIVDLLNLVLFAERNIVCENEVGVFGFGGKVVDFAEGFV